MWSDIDVTADGHVVFVLIVHVAHWLMLLAVTSKQDHTTKLSPNNRRISLRVYGALGTDANYCCPAELGHAG